MRYMGSKRRIAKYILPIMLKDRGNRPWVEPFVGGANIIDKVDGIRIGADINVYLIALLKALQEGKELPADITKEQALYIKHHKDQFPEWLVGWVGFGVYGWGGKFFNGYQNIYVHPRTKDVRYPILETRKNMVNQSKNIKDVFFLCCDYKHLPIPKNSLIYCDPPYKDTTKYKVGNFNHEEFWEWCRNKGKEGHIVYVSEHNAPSDFECVWTKDILNILNQVNGKRPTIQTEKLFKYIV